MAAPPSPDTKRLSDVVIDMLSSGLSDDEILTNLQQAGLPKDKARDVLDTAKAQFTQFTSKKLGGVVEKLTGEKLGKGLEDMKKDLGLQIDFKVMEGKGYTDKKFEEVRAELTSLKSEVTDMKISIDAKLKAALQGEQPFRALNMTQKLLAVAIIIAGIVSVVLLWLHIPGLFDLISKRTFDQNFLLYLLGIVLLAMVAIVGFVFGGKALAGSRKRYEAVGLEWMKDEK